MRDAERESAAKPAAADEAVAAERRRTTALAAVAQALYAGKGLTEVLSLALRCGAGAMGAADGSLFLFLGDDRTRLRGVAELLPLGRIDLEVELAASPGRLRALTERRAVVIPRCEAAGDEVTWFRRSGARWSITAPLFVGSRPLGLLLLNSCAARPPDEGDLELAFLVAGQCAVAIDRARIDEERERLLREVREQAEKLREDVAALRDLQERREDLVRTISHDLRTPLTAIHGQAQLLLKRAGGSEQVRQGASAILTSANRMNVLIQDLVDMTRAEIGHIRLETRPVHLLPFLEELRERFRWALEMDRLRFEVPADLPPLAADPGRLERILLNLLTNALKYSTPGTEVVVRGGNGGGTVAIAVEDRGPGIAPEDLPRIFDRFYRSGQVLRNTEGLGLGLYISRLLVEAMGGTLGVESELDRGSVFTARFPQA
jgi:signal transduction histidine kinase